MGKQKQKAEIPTADLKAAYDGSWYTIAGCGGDLQDWVTGVNGLLAENEIGQPTGWFQTTGGQVNEFADRKNGGLHYKDAFAEDLTILMFPLDGLDVGRLAIFKIRMQDRWFDDVIDNMRTGGE